MVKVREFEDAVNTGNIPAGQYAALYRDGRYAATEADAARYPHHRWITVVGDPDAGCGDYEPGNELYEAPGRLRAWVEARHAAGKRARVYCDRADAARAAAAVAGVPHLWWISTLDGKRWTAAELVAELERFGVTISPADLWAVQFEGGVTAGHDTSILLGEW